MVYHLIVSTDTATRKLLPEVLRREREELLRGGDSRVYDTTAWNLTMMHGLRALTLAMDVPSEAQPFRPQADAFSANAVQDASVVALVIDGADQRDGTAGPRTIQWDGNDV